MKENKEVVVRAPIASVKKGWGEEVWIANNEQFCGKLLKFNPGAKFSMHYHLSKKETFYVLSGLLLLVYYDLKNADRYDVIIKEGQCVDVPVGAPHQIKALEESVILEVSTTHCDYDSYRIGKGDSQNIF